MKKLFTLLCITIAFLSQQASAQIKKGEKMLGGNIGVTSTDYEQDNNAVEGSIANISIIPQLGFGVGNNWVVGVQAGYEYGKQKTTYGANQTQEQKFNTFSGGVFTRKFFPIGERFGIYGQGDVTYGRTKNKYKSSTGTASESNTNRIEVAVSPGAYFRTGKRFILEAEVGSLGYSRSSTKPEGAGIRSTSSTVFLGLSNNLSIGFKVVL